MEAAGPPLLNPPPPRPARPAQARRRQVSRSPLTHLGGRSRRPKGRHLSEAGPSPGVVLGGLPAAAAEAPPRKGCGLC